MDVLSDVLQTISLEGTLFLHAEMHEPWCVNVPRGADMARMLQPAAKQLAICHMVLEGRCWVQLQGGTAVALQSGDVVAFPHGDSHVIGSGLHHAPISIDDAVKVRMSDLHRLRYGGDGDQTVLACGWFAYQSDMPNPLLAALPHLLHAPLDNRPSGPWLRQSILFALAEGAANRPGSSAVVAKVAESLLLEALRSYIDTLPPVQTGWLSGLRDPIVCKCLELMHARPTSDWSVERLAQAVNVSRSVLAARFNERLGQPPMQYLKRWRLAMAARLLRGGRSSLLRVAEAVGYESEASFSRAFKAEYGMSPGHWRTVSDASAQVS